jgi:hypothetical protein
VLEYKWFTRALYLKAMGDSSSSLNPSRGSFVVGEGAISSASKASRASATLKGYFFMAAAEGGKVVEFGGVTSQIERVFITSFTVRLSRSSLTHEGEGASTLRLFGEARSSLKKESL